MLTPFVLATAIGSPIFGRMIDTYGVKKIIIAGLSFLTIGFYLLSKIGDEKWIYYLSGVFIGLGLSILAGSSLRYIMLNNTTIEDRAISQGMLTIFISVGQLFGSAVIGLLLASLSVENVYPIIFTCISILLIIILMVSLGLKKKDSQLS
jgi:MFS family permease